MLFETNRSTGVPASRMYFSLSRFSAGPVCGCANPMGVAARVGIRTPFARTVHVRQKKADRARASERPEKLKFAISVTYSHCSVKLKSSAMGRRSCRKEDDKHVH